jgi:glycerol-3-phosphate dehydrogenase
VADSGPVDLLVIGGGINGAGIARDAAGRGLSVVLCEKDDLASATSSASSKLIHGGLRYLEYYEFRLVREALIEREVLLRAAPHIIWPLRFVLPHDRGQRPAWMIRLGLFLYDHLGGRERLPGCEALALREDPAGQPLKSSLTKGFCYSDCWVDDARLVILNALDAKERGAEVLTRARCIGARRVDGLWEAELAPANGGAPRRLRARAMVNAAGPWVAETLQQIAGVNRQATLRLVKGSHIVVPRLHDGPQAYILQNTDRRVIFVLPYEDHFSLIGTTDLPYDGDPGAVAITEDEIGYLCAAVDRYFERPVDPTQVAWSYAGVRPLYDDASENVSAVTRDYVFDIDGGDGKAPLLSVYGGKITTYRKLAEHALAKLQPLLDATGTPWTERASLPGGDMADADFERFLGELRRSRPWLPASLAGRYARAYGTRVERLLDGRDSLDALGEDLGGGLHEAEVQYLVESEWAMDQGDILWRRSKLGLHVSKRTQERLADWLGQSDRTERRVATR